MEDMISKINVLLMRIKELISETVEDPANRPGKSEAEKLLLEIGKSFFLRYFEPDQERGKILLDPDYLEIQIGLHDVRITRKWTNGVVKLKVVNPDDFKLVTNRIIYAKLKKLMDPLLEKVGLEISDELIMLPMNDTRMLMGARYEVNDVSVDTTNCSSLESVFREVAKEMAYAD